MDRWRLIQKENFNDWKAFSHYLELQSTQIILPNPKFSLNIPRRLAAKIRKNDFTDPILRQFLPTQAEMAPAPLFILDPVGDKEAQKSSKLLSKYQGRALLLVTSACAMNCRFCFRQNFEYEKEQTEYQEELSLIRQDVTLREVILSGGDPLSLSTRALENLVLELDKIPHLTKLRFHTRFPIGIPERIDESLLRLFAMTRIQIIFTIHCNHPRELDTEVLRALRKIQCLGIPILSQTVLLKGVNNEASTLIELFHLLSDHGILPYYLNQLDRVQGASHFEVPQEEGIALMRRLRESLPGYAVPRFVQEIAGQPHKTPLN